MKAVKAGPRHLAMMSDVEQCKQNDMQYIGRFQRYVCDILTTFFIFETLQMNVISLQDV